MPKKSVFANKSAQKSTLKSTFGSSEPICKNGKADLLLPDLDRLLWGLLGGAVSLQGLDDGELPWEVSGNVDDDVVDDVHGDDARAWASDNNHDDGNDDADDVHAPCAQTSKLCYKAGTIMLVKLIISYQ